MQTAVYTLIFQYKISFLIENTFPSQKYLCQDVTDHSSNTFAPNYENLNQMKTN